MILVRVQGGLGNQMFQYAFGKMLAKKNKTVLKIDTSLLTNNRKANDVIRNFDLDIFKLNYELATEKEIAYFNGYPEVNIFQRLYFKISKMLDPRNLLIQDEHFFDEAHLASPDNTCVVGRWQSDLYFKEALKEVKDDFEIQSKWLLNSEFTKRISEDPFAVSLHVRREDYVFDENNNKVRSGLVNGSLDVSYYYNAVKFILSKIKSPVFYIFSEDLEWSLANLSFIPGAVFVKAEKTKKGMAEDLHLISLCKYHIISNSTFSWWGAYLSKHTGKIVIAPKQWSFTDDRFAPPYIIPSTWVPV